jgi:hypothetical protein
MVRDRCRRRRRRAVMPRFSVALLVQELGPVTGATQ